MQYIYIYFIVPPSVVTITGSPINDEFHVGLDLTLIGRTVFNSAVDTPIELMVSSSWISPRNSFTTATKKVNGSYIQFITKLSIKLQNITTDSGNYTVIFSINSSSILDNIVMGYKEIIVQRELNY